MKSNKNLSLEEKKSEELATKIQQEMNDIRVSFAKDYILLESNNAPSKIVKFKTKDGRLALDVLVEKANIISKLLEIWSTLPNMDIVEKLNTTLVLEEWIANISNFLIFVDSNKKEIELNHIQMDTLFFWLTILMNRGVSIHAESYQKSMEALHDFLPSTR